MDTFAQNEIKPQRALVSPMVYRHTYNQPKNPDILPGPKSISQTLVSVNVFMHSGEPGQNLILRASDIR